MTIENINNSVRACPDAYAAQSGGEMFVAKSASKNPKPLAFTRRGARGEVSNDIEETYECNNCQDTGIIEWSTEDENCSLAEPGGQSPVDNTIEHTKKCRCSKC